MSHTRKLYALNLSLLQLVSWLEALDQRLFLFLNGMNTPWLDPIMGLISAKWTWLPFYAVLLAWMVSVYKKQVWKLLLAVTFLIFLTDRISSGIFKPWVQRDRPCHTLSIQAQVHTVDGCGGQWGFMSSHAANVFGLALMLWILLHKRSPGIAWMFAWAVLVSYSRIYVGAHYPLDILAGFGLGTICSFAVLGIFNRVGSLKIPESNSHRSHG